MKINHKHILLGVATLCGSALTGCNDIAEGDRYIELPQTVVTGTLRNILVEEYTGQKCINCPNAHETIAQLLSQPEYAERLIPVSIHCGGSAFSVGEGEMGPSVQGLRLPEGEAYFKESGGSALPCGQINRTSGILNYDAWAAAVRNYAALESPLFMTMEPTLSYDGASIDVNLTLVPDGALSGNLVVWVIESGITSFQLLPSGAPSLTYVHNHVLRGCVTAPEGQALTLTDETTVNLTAQVRSHWNTDNLAIVAFVYNETGVIQSLEAHLGETNSNIVVEHIGSEE